ncbi:MAG: sodium:solute symporter [Planctomycetaceae bacterium]|nr:sodium:solute symporter [Planctomycetaceae bacterium]
MNDPAATTIAPGFATLGALLSVIVVSVWLGAIAQRAVERGSFLQGYFLGNRGLGVWAMALTATVQSGGTFMGFPSLVYSHGWIVALWIAGYMMVPITGFGVLGKRFAQLSRRTGAITVPDLFRERFGSPGVGLVASLLILFCMSFMMIAQFKAGAILMKLSWPGTGVLALAEDAAGPAGWDRAYLIGLIVFSVTVVGYTMIGGFLASVWTDLFQSVLMFVGVLALVLMAVPAAHGLEAATRTAIENTSPDFVFGPGYATDGRAFLPISLGFSFFIVWTFGGMGSPAGLVRVMASKDTATIRRSIIVLALYNMVIYLPLIMICIAARAIMPNLAVSDEVIPRMALWTTRDLPGGSLLAGVILAAPFGAVMATVSTYLVVIASGLVHDVYQRFVEPHASDRRLRLLTYGVTIAIGLAAVAANISPPQYLQALVVFSGTCTASAFLVPALMAAYWRRATALGAQAAMLCGAATVFALYVAGWQGTDPMIGVASKFRPHFLLGLDPICWGLLASLVAGIGVSLMSSPPDRQLVSRLFDILPTDTNATRQPKGSA